ncbi:HMG box mitochondrial protein [Yamadazyma tenuis]|uniref:HMG box domain-containing protein n=1 Tax=Candida tenuis (strain ATCC 10573 / BCRC 21748 / CBS 615 / JCM 9827 / NBRC 10315 / NRRL Y-1498 / VKM Y-70) TaxID=590646 RepID=G3B378_CANTC|nr:uncharacterized protein CANTEDRAFT_114137 [Yamadazyma tenuis ATCC 10573]EGV64100.1 hypothetical protein CANTEDRAFT_114137 [Yamadazyma tenuis ATCC 10573]WEJ96265.1 HMG box mitochondrial protein [Yamadazyma tenuis]
MLSRFIVRSNAYVPLVAACRVQSRQFSWSMAMWAAAAKAKTKKSQTPEAIKLQLLKDTLKTEKSVYKKLQEKYSKAKAKETEKKKKVKAKESQQKEKAKNDVLLKKALKTPRKLSPFNIFVKERKAKDITEASKEWKELTDFEKDEFADKADAYNEDILAVFSPKPKAPVFGFAAYVKKNFIRDGRDNVEVLKELSSQWKQLSSSEKAPYTLDKTEWARYQEQLKDWKRYRIDVFNDKNGTSLSS